MYKRLSALRIKTSISLHVSETKVRALDGVLDQLMTKKESGVEALEHIRWD